MSFREMLEHQERTRKKNIAVKHPNGTYVAAKLSKPSQKQLDQFVIKHNIPNAADPKQYHSTIIYSRKGVPDVESYPFGLPIKAHVKEWKLFDTKYGNSGKCLVAIMDSPELDDYHYLVRKLYGAQHDYPDYHPHVTVSYDYDGPLPKETPTFGLEYDAIEIKPLDPEFVPPKKDQ